VNKLAIHSLLLECGVSPSLVTTVMSGWTEIFESTMTEAHDGLFRNVKEFISKSNLKAAEWNDYLIRELVYPWINTLWFGSRTKTTEISKRQYLQERIKNVPQIKDIRVRQEETKKLKEDLAKLESDVNNTFEAALSNKKALLFDVDFKEPIKLNTKLAEFQKVKNFVTGMDTYESILTRLYNRIATTFSNYEVDTYNVPADAVRHKMHEKSLKQNDGINRDPVIFLQTKPNEYSLIEGNHRTVEMLLFHVMNPLVMEFSKLKRESTPENFMAFVKSQPGTSILDNTPVILNAYVGQQPGNLSLVISKLKRMIREHLINN
jgi:hypothetical protein